MYVVVALLDQGVDRVAALDLDPEIRRLHEDLGEVVDQVVLHQVLTLLLVLLDDRLGTVESRPLHA